LIIDGFIYCFKKLRNFFILDNIPSSSLASNEVIFVINLSIFVIKLSFFSSSISIYSLILSFGFFVFTIISIKRVILFLFEYKSLIEFVNLSSYLILLLDNFLSKLVLNSSILLSIYSVALSILYLFP